MQMPEDITLHLIGLEIGGILGLIVYMIGSTLYDKYDAARKRRKWKRDREEYDRRRAALPKPELYPGGITIVAKGGANA